MTNENELFERYLKSRRRVQSQAIKYLRNNPIDRLFFSSQSRSKKSGVDFNISKEDIVVPTHCPYLGVPLTNISGQGRQPSNLSLDRIDNTKGYVKGNIQVISDLANRMKQDATLDQLVQFAKNVLDKHG